MVATGTALCENWGNCAMYKFVYTAFYPTPKPKLLGAVNSEQPT